jgi:hypothetical protein
VRDNGTRGHAHLAAARQGRRLAARGPLLNTRSTKSQAKPREREF